MKDSVILPPDFITKKSGFWRIKYESSKKTERYNRCKYSYNGKIVNIYNFCKNRDSYTKCKTNKLKYINNFIHLYIKIIKIKKI